MQVEPIINVRFKKFRESFGLTNIQDGEAFERFVNHAILSVHQPDAFTADSDLLESVCVGGPGDMGIDGLAIKVNGLLIQSKEDIEDILKKFKRASVEFIFIQSKYKPAFNKGELNNFVDGVRDFLSEHHRFPMNEKVKNLLYLKEYLLSDEVFIMWEKNPQVTLYYVAMGKWRNAPDLIGLSDHFKSDLASLDTFEDAVLHFVDSESLKTIYDSIENAFTETINTRQIMPLTDVDGVSNSCIALIYANEFLKLLTTKEGVIRKSLFDDNVRDFQGSNYVNSEILETIYKEPSKFILLNNGLAVVCDEFKQNNTRLTISNPQIVNGCQTSHVIYNAFKKGVDVSKVPLTIKFISTNNLDISNEIVRGTNRQNIVPDEAFETTKKFHKDLEQFFNAISQDYQRIYFERRVKQYSHNPTIKQTQKINLRILTQHFVGMFLNEPHVAHRHESILLKEFANRIFQENHSKLPYFTVGLSFYSLEKLFREQLLQRSASPYKSHLLMMFRQSVAGDCPNLYLEKKIDLHSNQILLYLSDQEQTKQRFLELVKILDDSKAHWIEVLKRDQYRIKDIEDFTQILIDRVRKKYNIVSEPDALDEDYIYTGKVVKMLIDKYGKRYGFIERQPEAIFFHANQNRDLDIEGVVGKRVTYKVSINPKDKKRIFASDVKLVL